MVWGAFSSHGKSHLAIMDGNQDSNDYIYIISEYLLPFIDRIYGRDCIFQQDNASIHASSITRTFFNEQDIDVLDWPARSPDLNPIENIWGLLAKRVYPPGKYYESRNQLKRALMKHWNELEEDYLKKLTYSMEKRCIEVIKKKGSKIDY